MRLRVHDFGSLVTGGVSVQSSETYHRCVGSVLRALVFGLGVTSHPERSDTRQAESRHPRVSSPSVLPRVEVRVRVGKERPS